jgi:hypothetical protein
MKKDQHILFLQDFSMGRKGGGVSIIKRLIEFAPKYNYITSVGCDLNANKGIKLDAAEQRFFTLPRNFRFGIGRLIGSVTIFGLDIWAAASLKRLIRRENPDVIHIVAHGVCFPAIARAALKSGKNVILSVHDAWSWTVAAYISEPVADRLFKKLTRDIATVYAISGEMKEYLVELCGPKNYHVVHDGLATAPFITKKIFPAKSLSLFYAGIMHSMQLSLFAALLKILGSFQGWQFDIGICSNSDYMTPQMSDNITITNYGWVDENRLKDISSQYMYGVLPLSFDPKDELFYRTSLMTKIPFYMSVGLPIICLGPASASAIKLIDREQTGVVITAEDTAVIKNSIVRLLEQQETQYPLYLQHITQSATTTFNINLLAARFYTNLNSQRLYQKSI